MDRAMIEEHLAMAERHVAEGTRHVLEQGARRDALLRHGHDSAEATRLLVQMEELLKLYLQDRDRLRAKLAEKKWDHPPG